jgi:hypothetical protein
MGEALQPMMYSAVIQQTWRLNKYRYPAIMSVPLPFIQSS